MRLTIFTGAYPVGQDIGGIGLRYWELAQALAGTGVHTTLVCPPGSDPSWTRAGVAIETFGEDTWRDRVDASAAVMTGAEPDPRVILHAHRAGKLLIAEAGVPVEHLDYDLLRGAEDPARVYAEVLATYQLQVLTADHMVTRAEIERAGVYATLACLGRLSPLQHARSRTLDHLVSLLPIGFGQAADLAARAAPVTAEPVDFTWSGGIWDFYDTGAVTAALTLLREEGVRPRVRFLYAPPAHQLVDEAGRLEAAVRREGLQDQVQRYPGPLDHTARDGVLKASRALVCLGRPGVENEICVRLRMRDALLYRTPVVVDRHGASGDWVRAQGIGLAVDTRDPRQVADALTALARDTAAYTGCLHALERIRPNHFFEANIGPLLRVLEAGERAPDAGCSAQSAAVERLLADFPALNDAPLQLT